MVAAALLVEWIPATEIDGGLEWNGAHCSVPNSTATPAIIDPLIAWWTSVTGMTRIRVVVTASPIKSNIGYEIRTVLWKPLLFFGNATLHGYQMMSATCP